ncbi:helix-turn-helix domain-containing protein, partial [Litoreibacter janthinus]
MSFGAKFGLLVKGKREARGWSLANLALEVFGDDGSLGESRKGDVHKLETGQTAKPRASTIKRYCDALGISQDDVDTLRSPDQMPSVTQMRRLLAERDHLKAGKTLTELQVIGLAERVAENIPDFDAALRELDQALTVAEDLKTRSQQTSNHADFIDKVFAEVQRLNDEDNPDEAAATLQRAYDEGAAQQARLLDSLIAQHALRQDVDATLNAILAKLPMDVPDPSKHFDALRAIRYDYRQQGLTHGTRFPSLMAIALAETCKDRAQSKAEKGAALNDLGIALSELGTREDSPDRLNAAVKAFDSALEVYTKDALPMEWATTQNNLGIALQELGKREDSPDRLNAAVKAFDSALEVRTKNAMPKDWAMT